MWVAAKAAATQIAAAMGAATAGAEAKMMVETAETEGMTVVGRKVMELTASKAAATAAIDCRGGRDGGDGSNGRKSGNNSSACTDRRYGRDTTVEAGMAAAMAVATARMAQ